MFSLDQVLASPDLAQEIATLRRRYGSFEWSMLEKATFSYPTYQEKIMVKTIINGDNIRFNQAIGKQATASQNEVRHWGPDINLADLTDQLAQLRAALDGLPPSPERDVIKGSVGKAEIASNSGDGTAAAGALKELKPFGSKVLEIAQKIGIPVAVAAIKSAIGV